MVVDDEAPIRKLVQQHLTPAGYSVIPAADGASALRIYREAADRPKLIILDVGMPGMDGWECLEQLRRFDSTVKVLLATGYARDEFIARANRLGAAGIVFKPYKQGELAKRVREILDAPAQ